MTLFALILALILEQVRPLGGGLRTLVPIATLADGVSRRLNDGTMGNGRVAWLLLVGLRTFCAAFAYWLLWEMQPVFALVFNVVVLYLCMGFRHESQCYTEIHLALRMGELERARSLLAAWRGGRYDEASASEIARLAIEMALVAAHLRRGDADKALAAQAHLEAKQPNNPVVHNLRGGIAAWADEVDPSMPRY